MDLQADEKEEMIRENEINYGSGSSSPYGPLKFMSADAKEKVNLAIDEKMQALEDTGLTKEEVLHERPGGIKLADDPFY